MMEKPTRVIVILIMVACAFTQGQTKRDIIVSTVIRPPFVTKQSNEFSGIIVDLINALAREGNWSKVTFKLPTKGLYGEKQTSGDWDGVIGDVGNGVADIGAADFVETTERKKTASGSVGVIDFTKPYFVDSFTLLVKSYHLPDRYSGIKLLFAPLDVGNWIMLLVICLVVGAAYSAINHFSPSEWSNIPPEEDKTNGRDSFTPKNAFFFVHSTLNWQGYREVPRSPAGRFVTTMWFSCVAFMIYGYTASLTSILMTRPPSLPVIPVKSFRTLLTDPELHVLGTRSVFDMKSIFMESVDRDMPAVYERIAGQGYISYSSMEENDRKVVDALLKADNNAVTVLPKSIARHYSNKNCDLVTYDKFLSMSYRFVIKKNNSAFQTEVDDLIRNLRENGEITKIFIRWQGNNACGTNDPETYLEKSQVPVSKPRPLTVADLAVAYILLLIGLLVGLVMLVVETVLHRKRNKESTSPPEAVVLSSTNGGTTKGEGGSDEEKAPIAVDEP